MLVFASDSCDFLSPLSRTRRQNLLPPYVRRLVLHEEMYRTQSWLYGRATSDGQNWKAVSTSTDLAIVRLEESLVMLVFVCGWFVWSPITTIDRATAECIATVRRFVLHKEMYRTQSSFPGEATSDGRNWKRVSTSANLITVRLEARLVVLVFVCGEYVICVSRMCLYDVIQRHNQRTFNVIRFETRKFHL